MFDAHPPSPTHQRSHGRAAVALSRRSGAIRLDGLVQEGSAKAFLPRVHRAVPEVVFLNTSGGLTGGDRLALTVDLGASAQAVATTQTAERAYAAGGAAASVTVAAQVGAGGRLDWLPQETILYEGSDLDRQTTIDLAADATCLMAEMVILGRHAMGETLREARLRDARVVRRAGRPVWAETLRLDAGTLARGGDAAVLGGARAFAVIALIGPEAEDALPRLRAALDLPGVEAAASAWDGKCVARLMAPAGWPLRRAVARTLAALREGPLPRVWQI
ncbi:MAG: urease accessory protein UreD [Gemmobacter sp.]